MKGMSSCHTISRMFSLNIKTWETLGVVFSFVDLGV